VWGVGVKTIEWLAEHHEVTTVGGLRGLLRLLAPGGSVRLGLSMPAPFDACGVQIPIPLPLFCGAEVAAVAFLRSRMHLHTDAFAVSVLAAMTSVKNNVAPPF
jgi:hypothetical protein